jgi:hypothetical protein
MRNLFFIAIICFGFNIPCIAQLMDNGDGTVTDNNSGLTWLQNSLPASNGGDGKTWQDALSWAVSLVFASHDDWRLPSALEFGAGTPDLGFNSVKNEWGNLYGNVWNNPANTEDISPMHYYPCCYYWTSTEKPDDYDKASAFFISYDDVWGNSFFTKSTLMRYTAVRGTAAPVLAPQCRDGYDNDHDGKIDFPADGGCSSLDDNNEKNVCFTFWNGRTYCLSYFKITLIFVAIISVSFGLFYYLKRKKKEGK